MEDGIELHLARGAKVMDALVEEIEELEADLATAQARLAVMGEALGLALIPMVSEEKKLSVEIEEYYLTSSLDWWQEKTLSQLETRKAALADAQDAVMKALSTTPEVVWSEKARILHGIWEHIQIGQQNDYTMLEWKDSRITTIAEDKALGKDKQQVTVYVVASARKAEGVER